MTYRMGDSVTVTNVPEGLDVYAGYSGGRWPDYGAMVTTFPGKRYLAYAIRASDWGDGLDIENSDAAPGDFLGWSQRIWRAVNTPKPVAYSAAANAGNVVEVAGPRNNYLLITAHWTDIPHICTSAACAPDSPVPWVADGTQWTTHGNTWDESLLASHFYDTIPVPVPVPPPVTPTPGAKMLTNCVGMEKTRSGNGYWLFDASGEVYSHGDAVYHGGCNPGAPGAPAGFTGAIVAMEVTVSGNGYWLVDAIGEVYSFGDAKYYGGGQ